MGQIEPLEVTVELPFSEFIDHDNGLYVRCPLNGNWVPLTDYYSEKPNEGLLPLVGRVDFETAPDHWDTKKDPETGEVVIDPETNQPVMERVAKDKVVWKEVVRVLPKPVETPAKGGTLSISVHDETTDTDHFGA